jgi:hypothetical protein
LSISFDFSFDVFGQDISECALTAAVSALPSKAGIGNAANATTDLLIRIPFGPESVVRFPPAYALTKLAVSATEEGAKAEQLFRTFLEKLATSTWSRSSAG